MGWKSGLLAMVCVMAVSAGFAAPDAFQAEPPVRSEMLVTTDWLAGHLSDPNTVVLHVGRDRKAYDEGHIPGAQFLSWDDVATTRGNIANELPTNEALTALARRMGIEANDRIILYDDKNGLEAARAYVAFDYMGLGDRTALLDGHLKKWRKDRLVTSEAPEVRPSEVTLRFRPEIVAELDEVRRLAAAESRDANAPVALIDARPEKQYAGEEQGQHKVARPGHIPGAANVFWERHIESPENPVIKPVEELRKIYREAGVRPKDKVVTYCTTGGQASHAYFITKHLGYDTRIYDGSFSEWSQTEGLEIEKGLKRQNLK